MTPKTKSLDNRKAAGSGQDRSPAPKRELFLPITPALQKHAHAALNAWNFMYEELEALPYPVFLTLHYMNVPQAQKAAQELSLLSQELQSPQTTGQPFADDTTLVSCPVHFFLAEFSQVKALVQNVTNSHGKPFTKVAPEVKQLAKAFVQLFTSPAFPRATIRLDTEQPQIASELEVNIINTHEAVIGCLATIVNSCQSNRPKAVSFDGPVTQVFIRSNASIDVPEIAAPLNKPREAAIIILALLGTERVSTEEFAKHYSRVAREGEETNWDNVFRQAMAGLQKSIPTLRFELGDTPHYRHVFGIKIHCEVDNPTLESVLNGLRPPT